MRNWQRWKYKVGSLKSETFTLKELKGITNTKEVVTKKVHASPVKASKEVSSSKPKYITKKPTKKEIQEPKTANKKSFSTNSGSHANITSNQSLSKMTSKKTNKKQYENHTSKTEHQLLVPEKIKIPSKNVTSPIICGNATKTLIIFTICIVVNDEILKGLTDQGLTMIINLAKE